MILALDPGVRSLAVECILIWLGFDFPAGNGVHRGGFRGVMDSDRM